MAVQREQAAPVLRPDVPHLDFVVVAAGDEQRAARMEVDAADGPCRMRQCADGAGGGGTGLRVPQSGRRARPCGSSRAARCRCAARRPAAAASGGMQGLQRSMSGKQAEARGGRTLDAIALGLELGEHNRHFGQRLFQARYADVS